MARQPSISTLLGLLVHPTYSKLIRAEAFIDMSDETFVSGPMRRSPYHLIQFLVFWAALADSEIEKALLSLNALLQKQNLIPLENNELSDLIHSIDWHAILQQTKALQLLFEVPSRERMLSALEKNYHSLFVGLSEFDIVNKGADRLVVGKSTFQQNATWVKEFLNTQFGRESVWEIPAGGFTLTKDLVDRIAAGCANPDPVGSQSRREIVGFFDIQYGTLDGSVKVYVEKPTASQDTFVVKQDKARIDSGLYKIFEDRLLEVRTPLLSVEGVQVYIEGNASFGQKGAHVTQTQTVGMFLGGSSDFERGTPTTIVVRRVEALFPFAGVPVSFYSGESALNKSLPEGRFGIRVLAKGDADVVLLPERLLPIHVAAAILAADSTKPYQPADTHACGLQGEGMQYVRYPAEESVNERYAGIVSNTKAYANSNARTVFIGQIPRYLPLPYVSWALEQLTGIQALWVLQTQVNGCAKAWISPEAFEVVNPKNPESPRVFFDTRGIWIATTPDALARMKAHQADLQANPAKVDSRLCRAGMVIEALRAPASKQSIQVSPGAGSQMFRFLPLEGMGRPGPAESSATAQQSQSGTIPGV